METIGPRLSRPGQFAPEEEPDVVHKPQNSPVRAKRTSGAVNFYLEM